jgi:hypothetical protein
MKRKGWTMNKQQATEKLYDIKKLVDCLPRFKGRAKIINELLNMIHFINNHVADHDLNQKFIDQAEYLMNQANVTVDRMNREPEQLHGQLTL